MAGFKYGWRPQRPDQRDYLFAAAPEVLKRIPSEVDLRPTGHLPPVFDQGPIGSCTANAIAGAVAYDRSRQGLAGATRTPSRLMIYYDEREIEGTILSDSGAALRDGIKSMVTTGTCFEDGPDGWPYDVTRYQVKPPANCYAAALHDRAMYYSSVTQSAQQVRGCLASGFPVVFGFTVYESFGTDAVARTGFAPMPGLNEAMVGGHAVMIVGYRDSTRNFLCRNSWGPGWGIAGYFWLPYEYVLSKYLAADFWMLRTISP